jgi:hypothetical protein
LSNNLTLIPVSGNIGDHALLKRNLLNLSWHVTEVHEQTVHLDLHQGAARAEAQPPYCPDSTKVAIREPRPILAHWLEKLRLGADMERLADLDELVLRCRNEEAKGYIAEAVGAYRSACYRSAIASTWVAVVYDLIGKIREIALTGNNEAKKFADDLNGIYDEIHKGNSAAIQRALKIEREILETSKSSFELLDQIQFEDLSRLRDDRNRCAHPTYHLAGSPYSPSAEQARLHIRNAITHVLSQPPVLGRAAITTLITVVSSDYFPSDVDRAKTQLLESGFGRPSVALVNGFVDTLMFAAIEKANPLYLKRKSVIALVAAATIQPAQAESRIVSNINKQIKSTPEQSVLQFVLAVLVMMPHLWHSCGQSTQHMLSEFVKNEKLEVFLKALDGIKQIAELHSTFEARVGEMPTEDLEQIVSVYQEEAIVSRCVDLFAESGSWSVALGRYKRLIAPIIGRITKEHVLLVLEATSKAQNDLKRSNGFEVFLNAIMKQGILEREQLSEVMAGYGLSDQMPDDLFTLTDDDIPF